MVQSEEDGFYDTVISQGVYRGRGRQASSKKLDANLQPIGQSAALQRQYVKEQAEACLALLADKLLPELNREAFLNSDVLERIFLELKFYCPNDFCLNTNILELLLHWGEYYNHFYFHLMLFDSLLIHF